MARLIQFTWVFLMLKSLSKWVYFDPVYIRNQDYEFNWRVRQAGKTGLV